MATETFLLISTAALFCFSGFLFVSRHWQARKNRKLFCTPLSPSHKEILLTNVGIYQKLPEKYRQELHGHIQIFLSEKEFIGCAGLEVTEEIRLTIAANACILLLTGNHQCFAGFHTILIYPDTYHILQSSHEGDVKRSHISSRSGESWYRGPVVLSWGDVLRGSMNNEDGFNVVLHEFAHKLDEENSLMDGLPVLRDKKDYAEWAETLNREYKAFQTRVAHGKNRVIDAYGATSPVEFFAVATESFFEKPRQMQKRLPELYKQLSTFYGLDPSTW